MMEENEFLYWDGTQENSNESLPDLDNLNSNNQSVHQTKVSLWLNSAKNLPLNQRLRAAKDLTLLELRDNNPNLPLATVLRNTGSILKILSLENHQKFVSHVLKLWTAGKNITRFEDFLLILKLLSPSNSYKWLKTQNYSKEFCKPEAFYKALENPKSLLILCESDILLNYLSLLEFQQIISITDHLNQKIQSLYSAESQPLKKEPKNHILNLQKILDTIKTTIHHRVSRSGLEKLFTSISNIDQKLQLLQILSPKYLNAQVPKNNPERFKKILALFPIKDSSFPQLTITLLEILKTQWINTPLHETMLKTAMESLDLTNVDSFFYYQSTLLNLINSMQAHSILLDPLFNKKIWAGIFRSPISIIDYIREKTMHPEQTKAIQYFPIILELMLAINRFNHSARINYDIATLEMWENIENMIRNVLQNTDPEIKETISIKIKRMFPTNRRNSLFEAIHSEITQKKEEQTQIRETFRESTISKIPDFQNNLCEESAHSKSISALEQTEGTPFFVDLQMIVDNCHINSTELNKILNKINDNDTENVYAFQSMQTSLGNAISSVAQRTDFLALELLALLLNHNLDSKILMAQTIQNSLAKGIALSAKHFFGDEYYYLRREKIPYALFTFLLDWIRLYDPENQILTKTIPLFIQFLSPDNWLEIIELWPDKKTIIAIFWHNSSNEIDQTYQKAFLHECIDKWGILAIDESVSIQQVIAYFKKITPLNSPEKFFTHLQYFRENAPKNGSHFQKKILSTLQKQWNTILESLGPGGVPIIMKALIQYPNNQKILLHDYAEKKGLLAILPFISMSNDFNLIQQFSLTINTPEKFKIIIAHFKNLNLTENPQLNIVLLELLKTQWCNDPVDKTLLTIALSVLNLDIPEHQIYAAQFQPLLLDNESSRETSEVDDHAHNEQNDIPLIQEESPSFCQKSSPELTSTLSEETDKTQPSLDTILQMDNRSDQLSLITNNPQLIDTPEKFTIVIQRFTETSQNIDHPVLIVSLLETLQSQWLEPFNEPMLKIALNSLSLDDANHKSYYETVYSILFNTCSEQNAFINFNEKFKLKWRSSSISLKDYLVEKKMELDKKKDSETSLSDLMTMVVALKCFNQKNNDNTEEDCQNFIFIMKKGLHLLKSNQKDRVGGRRDKIEEWLNIKISDYKKGLSRTKQNSDTSINYILPQIFLKPAPSPRQTSETTAKTNELKNIY